MHAGSLVRRCVRGPVEVVRVTESWCWPCVVVARGHDVWLLNHTATLLEDEVVVVLIHLGDILLHQLTVKKHLWIFIRV